MRRVRWWFLAWGVSVLLFAPASSALVSRHLSAAAAPVSFAGSWAEVSTITTPCGGEVQRDDDHRAEARVERFQRLVGPTRVVGSQSGLSVDFTESGSGYVATVHATIAADGSSFKGNYTDNQKGDGTLTGTRISGPASSFVLSGTVEAVACGAPPGACEAPSPVAGVLVTASGARSAAATTGSDGAYSMALPAGTYTVTPGASGRAFRPTFQTVDLKADTSGVDFETCKTASDSPSSKTTLRREGSAESALSCGGVISGYVSYNDGTDSAPSARGVPGATVKIRGAEWSTSTETNSEGFYTADVRVGSYVVTPRVPPAWQRSYGDKPRPETSPVTVPAGGGAGADFEIVDPLNITATPDKGSVFADGFERVTVTVKAKRAGVAVAGQLVSV